VGHRRKRTECGVMTRGPEAMEGGQKYKGKTGYSQVRESLVVGSKICRGRFYS
jgi:hypothetical protein